MVGKTGDPGGLDRQVTVFVLQTTSYEGTVRGDGADKRYRVGPTVVLVILLSAATLLVYRSDLRFKAVSEVDLPNLDFAEGVAEWFGAGASLVEGTPRAALLAPAEGVRVPFVARYVPEAATGYLRVGADIAVQEVEPGRLAWQRAYLLLWSLGPDGERLRHWPHEIARLEGTSEWQRYQGVIPAADAAGKHMLVAYMGAESGEMQVRGFRLETVEERAPFRTLRLVLGILWVATAAWVVGLLLRRRWRSLGRLLTVACGLAILLGAIVPQPHLSNAVKDVKSEVAALWLQFGVETTGVADRLAGDDEEDQAPTEAAETQRPSERDTPALRIKVPFPVPILALAPTDKFAHFFAFAILTVLALTGFPHMRHVVPALAALVLFALVVEVVQNFVVTRETQMTDVTSNAAGIMAGGTLYLFTRSLLAGASRWLRSPTAPRPG